MRKEPQQSRKTNFFCRTSKNAQRDVCRKGQVISAGVSGPMKAGIAKNVLSDIYDDCRKRRQIGQRRRCRKTAKIHAGCCHLLTTSGNSLGNNHVATSQTSGRPLMPLRNECKADYNEIEL